MKKNILYTSALIIVMSLFTVITSCEEVIEIDLNSSDPRLVIEGVITDQSGPYKVQITNTTDYYNPGDYPTISGAVVTISDDAGNFETLSETEPGIYQTDSLQGFPGRSYSLSVEINDEIYEASSTMPNANEIDSLYNTFEERGFRGDVYSFGCIFTDNPGVEDYCRIKVYRNNDADPTYFLYNGRLSDGNTIEYERFRRMELELNDTVKVELLSIDEGMYDYFSTLSNVVASDPRMMGSTQVPANPISNISGDVLGYFGAFTVRSDSIIIKK